MKNPERSSIKTSFMLIFLLKCLILILCRRLFSHPNCFGALPPGIKCPWFYPGFVSGVLWMCFICMARGWRFQAPCLSLLVLLQRWHERELLKLPKITSTLDKVTLRHQTSPWFKSRWKNQLWLTLFCMCTFTRPLQHEQTHAKHTWNTLTHAPILLHRPTH